MRKIKYVLLLCLLVIIATGCVKFNATMDIKSDKSMDFSIIYAFDKTILGEDASLKEEDFQELAKEGFTITKYSEGNMEGFKLSKSIKNIDEVSQEEAIEYNLSGMMQADANSEYMFKVEKGFLKNTYTAKLKFDSSESGMSTDGNNANPISVDDEDYDYDNGEYDYIDEEHDDDDEEYDFGDEILPDESDSLNDENDISSSLDGLDASSLMANMDLSFSVNLPYGAKSNNATKSENNNKKLTWNLSATDISNIEFEFSLYNMNTVYIGVGVVLLIGVCVAVLIINSKKKKAPYAKVEIAN